MKRCTSSMQITLSESPAPFQKMDWRRMSLAGRLENLLYFRVSAPIYFTLLFEEEDPLSQLKDNIAATTFLEPKAGESILYIYVTTRQNITRLLHGTPISVQSLS